MTKEIINFCKYLNFISCCDQKNNTYKQKECSYYEKASRFNRCMYLKWDEYCDCIDAIKKTKEKNI